MRGDLQVGRWRGGVVRGEPDLICFFKEGEGTFDEKGKDMAGGVGNKGGGGPEERPTQHIFIYLFFFFFLGGGGYFIHFLYDGLGKGLVKNVRFEKIPSKTSTPPSPSWKKSLPCR